MQIASRMAGFTLGQADLLRRAMGKKKHDVLAAQRETFLQGAAERGIDAKAASDIFDLMAHFADYGFNKSHSAAYALVAYQTAYLKAHYRPEFMAALLTSVMGTNEKVGHYIEQCRRMGLAVLPPDINASQSSFSVDGKAIRFGLAAVKNVGENAILNVLEARNSGEPFTSLVDFCRRVDMRVVNKRVIESLIKCGAFDSLGGNRAQLLAVVDRAVDIAAGHQRDMASGQIGLFGEETLSEVDELILPDIADMPKAERLALEKEMTGFYVTGHPLDAFRDAMQRFTPVSEALEGSDGQSLRLAGLIVSGKRITTRNGGMMCFIELEDFTDKLEVVVFPRVFERYNRLLVPDQAVIVSGRLSVSDDGSKVLADSVAPLDAGGSGEVRIKVGRDCENAECFDRLKNALRRHNGEAVVYLQLMASRRVIKTEKQFWITPSPEVVAELETIVGKGMVVIR